MKRSFSFVSAYRRHSRAMPEWKGKRVFLRFSAGAMTAATVTVNGHKFEDVPRRLHAFSFDLTRI